MPNTSNDIKTHRLAEADGPGLGGWLSVTVPRGEGPRMFLRELACTQGHKATELALSPSVVAAIVKAARG